MDKFINYLLVLFVLVFAFKVNAQTITSRGHRVESILPSTEGIALIKSIERQPSLANGVPDIHFPIYSFTDVGLSIGLSYNASGFHVDELPSVAGMGWRLETGGRITRVVLGFPDDYSSVGYLNRSGTLDLISNKRVDQFVESDIDFLVNVDANNYDDSPDVFYYDVFGVKGKFVLGRDGSVYCFPKNNLKFIYEKGSSGAIEKFRVVLPNGVEGVFDMKETARTDIVNMTDQYTSSWLLTRTMDDNRTILLWDYSNTTGVGSSCFSYKENRFAYDVEIINATGVSSVNRNSYTIDFFMPGLTRISTGICEVNFKYTYHKVSGFATTNNSDWKRLKEITIEFAKDGFLGIKSPYSKRYLFRHENSTDNSPITSKDQLLLNGVDVATLERDVIIPFSFEYYPGNLPLVNSFGRDLWGYSNGKSNPHIVPSIYGSNGSLSWLPVSSIRKNGADRTANLLSMMPGMLKSITNPDGLVTEYLWGVNRFIYEGGEVLGSGLRVESINKYDTELNLLESMKFDYIQDNSNVSSGVMLYHPISAVSISNEHDLMISGVWTGTNTLIKASYHGMGILPFSSQVLYRKVLVYKEGLGTSSYYFELPIERTNLSILPSNLNWASSSIHSRVLNFGTRSLSVMNESDRRVPSLFSLWNTPVLIRKVDKNNNGVIVGKEDFYYGEIQSGVVQSGLKLYPVYEKRYKVNNIPQIDYKLNALKIYFISAWRELERIDKTIYSPDGSMGVTDTKMISYKKPDFGMDFSFEDQVVSYTVPTEKIIVSKKYSFDNDYSVPLDATLSQYSADLRICLKNCIRTTPALDSLPEGCEAVCYNIYDNSVKNMAHSEILGINLLRNRGSYSEPVEIKTVLSKDGVNTVMDYEFYAYEKQANGQILVTKKYQLNYPVSENSFQSPSVINSGGYRFNYNLSLYSPVYSVTQYGVRGEILEFLTKDGVYHANKMSADGNYYLLKCSNCRYDNIKNYLNGEQSIRLTNPKSMISTYSNLAPLGVIRETDARGQTQYNVFNTLGQIVATRDNNKNLRTIAVNKRKLQEGDSNIILETDPLGDRYLVDEWVDPGFINLSFVTDHDISVPLQGFVNYNPAYEWVINYGDGYSQVLSSSSFSHKYSNVGSYIVTLQCSRYGKLVKSTSRNVSVTVKSPLTVAYSYVYLPRGGLSYLNSSTCPFQAEDITIKALITKGTGTYNAEWSVSFIPKGSSSAQVTNLQVNLSPSGSSTSRTFNQEGTYSVSLIIRELGVVVKTQTWSFSIIYGLSKPLPQIEL